MIYPIGPGIPEIRCRLENRVRSTSAVTLETIEGAVSPETVEDVIWERLSHEVGRKLIDTLLTSNAVTSSKDPLRRGFLVTIDKRTTVDVQLGVRKYTLEATLWKVAPNK